jgi:hypothetical protein
MPRPTFCNASEHALSRRTMLAGLVGGGLALGGGNALLQLALAEQVAAAGKRLLLIGHHGGLSQYESWDPKPGTNYGGPCLAIPTSVPGIHISEWMPHTAKQMHHLLVVRSLSTGENNHGPGQYLMLSGRREGAGPTYPTIDCLAHKYLTPAGHPMPGFISVGGVGAPAFLGARYKPVSVKAGESPQNINLPGSVAAESNERRLAVLKQLNSRFAQRRGSTETVAYAYTFDQAVQLMHHKSLFDLSQEPPADSERYGTHDFGKACLLGRRLLEKGVKIVALGHPGYDTHAENFNVHLDLLQQFDRPFACLIEDLAARGMLQDTVVVAMGEFGRTPNINTRFGRDHWSGSWSAAFAGGSFPAGAVYGKTSANGAEVVDKPIAAAPLFHTMCKAIGIDASQNHLVDGQEIPIGDPAAQPIDDLLS